MEACLGPPSSETWEARLLYGLVDFHATARRWQALRLWPPATGSENDGQTWTADGKEDAIDLAANAAERDRLYATIPGGPQASMNGGTSFAIVRDAPLLTRVEALTIVFRPAVS